MINIKRDFLYLIIIFLLLVLDISIFLYFGVFNKKNINIVDDKYDSEFGWVLSDLNKEVATVDPYYIPEDSKNNTSIEISSNTALEYKDSNTMPYSLYQFDGYLGMNLSLSDNHNIDIVLISSNGKAYKFNIRTKGSTDSKLAYFKDVPKGKYRVFINDNDSKIDTMQFIVNN